MTQTAKYLYCIIRSGGERTFEDVAAIGDHGGPVYVVPHNGLAVVASDATAAPYEGTRANMLAHQRVQERVMRELTLLPVRFGTVTRDFASAIPDIQKLLDKRSEEFEGLLAEVEGKVELGLKALWRDQWAIFEEITSQDNGIRRLRDSLKGTSPLATHYERIRLGEQVKQALDRKKRSEAAGLLSPLRRIARRTVENPVMMDRMIVNAAFLVDNGRGEEFDRAVSELDEELGRRVAIRYVGPVPPYNFVNVVVNWQEL